VSVYFADDPKKLSPWFDEVHPSLLTVVPRALEKVFASVKNKIQNERNPLKKLIARFGIKHALIKNPAEKKNFIDRFLFNQIGAGLKKSLGGKLRLMICGGAALNSDLEKFYLNIGVNLYCGYGLTETSPVLAVNCEKYHKIATVGKKFPSVELKIAADGELLARGPNLMRGYHNNQAATREVIKNGWFKTGDLAQIDKEGFVKIVGRKKELFKTSTGKYVNPVKIEQQLIQQLNFLIGALIMNIYIRQFPYKKNVVKNGIWELVSSSKELIYVN
jgi:long-chain acyl-CoA synthetase